MVETIFLIANIQVPNITEKEVDKCEQAKKKQRESKEREEEKHRERKRERKRDTYIGKQIDESKNNSFGSFLLVVLFNFSFSLLLFPTLTIHDDDGGSFLKRFLSYFTY